MKVDETFNEIKIKEAPGCLWIFGLFFVLIGGMLLYGTLGGFSNWNEVPAWQLILAFFIAASVVAGGIWIISGAPVTNVVIDRVHNTVSVKKYGFFGRRSNFYSFDDVAYFCLIEEKDSDDLPIWSIGLHLKTQETVQITSLPIHAEELQQNHVFQFNEFMRKEMPSYQKNLKLKD